VKGDREAGTGGAGEYGRRGRRGGEKGERGALVRVWKKRGRRRGEEEAHPCGSLGDARRHQRCREIW